MSRRAAVLAFALVVAVGAAALADAAYYGRGATVVSASKERQELADDRTLSVDVARDGRWVVFDTRATNFFADDDPDPPYDDGTPTPVATDRQGGIFRRDLDSGALALVADGDLIREDDGTLLVRGARNPSVSADGRYVAFSTAQALVPADTDLPRRHVDVYVRDMNIPICRPLPTCGPNPYTLVSALDGTDTPFTYAAPAEEQPAGAPGSEISPQSAISSDGRRVAFFTAELDSDAPGAPDAVPGVPSTPPRQVLVRDLAARTTVLMSRVRPDAVTRANRPAGGQAGPVVLSGDGSTVAWTGTRAADQTRFQPGEAVDFRLEYLLWRRVDGTVTRRPTGMVDPDDPACAPSTPVEASDQITQAPCYGPLASWEQERGTISSFAPALSEDGYDVAFITASGTRPGPTLTGGYDLFLTGMRPGQTRKSSTVELTRDAAGDPAASAGIDGVAMTGDTRYLVVTTPRIRFLAPAAQLVGTTRQTVTARDVYLLDRQARTIERILTAPDGGDPNGDSGATPAVSAGAGLVAFTSAASNLFRGDANDRPDAFVIREQPLPVDVEPPPEPPPVEQPEAQGEVVPDPPTLFARVIKGKRTGEMIVEALPPGPGALETVISARLPDRDGKTTATDPIRRLARATGAARSAERVRMRVRLGKRPVALLKRLRRLTTSGSVRWTPADPAQSLQRTLPVRFVLVKPKRKKSAPKRTAKKKAAARKRAARNRSVKTR